VGSVTSSASGGDDALPLDAPAVARKTKRKRVRRQRAPSTHEERLERARCERERCRRLAAAFDELRAALGAASDLRRSSVLEIAQSELAALLRARRERRQASEE
jgi:hypothetical protein